MFGTPKTVLIFALLCPVLLVGRASLEPQNAQPTAPTSNTSPEERCVLQGRATNSLTGEPVKKATIRLSARRSGGTAMLTGAGNGTQSYAATSEADGSFRFENFDPGEYTLSGQRTGFLSTNYGAKGPQRPGTTLTLRPGQQMTNINLPLIPQAVISGRVLDGDGDPIEGVRIQLLGRNWVRGKQRYTQRNGDGTNDLGEYRIANVSPGKYYLYAEKMTYGPPSNDAPSVPGKPDVRPIRTFYPEAINIESATPIEVKAGQDLPGVDIRLHNAQTYHVRGKVVGNLSDGDSERSSVSLTPRNDEFSFMSPINGSTNVNRKDQTFDIAGVAPGSYNLEVVTMGGRMRALSRQPLDVGSGDVDDIALAIIPPGSVHGQIRMEGTPQAGAAASNLASIHVNIQTTEPSRFGANHSGISKADGTFTLDDVFPGKYYVNANAPSGSYLKSVRFGSQEVLGKELDIGQNVSGELDLVFRYGAAELDGTVQLPQSSSTASTSSNGQAGSGLSASIVLVPDVLNADGSGVRFGSATQSGTFSLMQVPPGQYHAYAFEDVNAGELENPDVLKQLEGQGTEVELKENDKKQIQVSLISADDLQQVFAKLGIETQ